MSEQKQLQLFWRIVAVLAVILLAIGLATRTVRIGNTFWCETKLGPVGIGCKDPVLPRR